jgi:Flp pilus assembly protein TadG
MRGSLLRFGRSDAGAGAVEFALIAPIMILVMLASIEIPRAVMTGQRLARSARTMADLISRQNLGSLDDVYAAGSAVTRPYDTSGMSVVLSAIGVYASGTSFVSKVCSSKAQNAMPRDVNSTVGPAPAASQEAKARYVMAEVTYTYKPLFNILPGLKNYTFNYAITWPIRKGTTYNGKPEIVLPDGKPCT